MRAAGQEFVDSLGVMAVLSAPGAAAELVGDLRTSGRTRKTDKILSEWTKKWEEKKADGTLQVKRLENGTLHAEDAAVAVIAGETMSVLKVGDPETGNLYGELRYNIDEDSGRIRIDDVATDPNLDQDVRGDIIIELGARYPGMEVEWNPVTDEDTDLKAKLVAENPRGLKSLQWFGADEGPVSPEVLTKNILRLKLREAMPRLSTQEREGAIILLDLAAEARGMVLNDYLKAYYTLEVFGTSDKVQAAQGKKGGVSFIDVENQAKAVIYVTENSDFSTWVHETAHIFRRNLEPELLNQAEAAFGVPNGDWNGRYNDKYTFEEAFAVGFEDWLKTGKAPDARLDGIFRRFADWLVRIYNSLKTRINISPEIEAVYSRLIADPASPLSRRSPAEDLGRNIPGPEAARGAGDVAFQDEEAGGIAEVRSLYEGTPQWMKAPNGEPTNLDERQWLQVRTPAFKKWFGDWVSLWRYQEVAKAFSEIVNGAEEATVRNLRSDLEEYGGTPDVTFIWGDDKKGLLHIGSRRGSAVVQKVIDAVVTGEITKHVPGKKTVHLERDGYEAVLSLDEHGEKKTWLLTGWKIKEPDVSGEVGTQSGTTQTGPTFSRSDLGAGSKFSIESLFESVKSSVSKIVDENGEPLVAYHNTNRNFKVFNLKYVRTSNEIQAFFFMDRPDEYDEYGKIRYPVFLNVRNPAGFRESVDGFKAGSTDDAGIKQRMKLIAAGYDGIYVSQEEGGMEYAEIAVFHPNQIKSAVDNIGTFDPKKPNILYQDAGEEYNPLFDTGKGTPLDDRELLFQVEENYAPKKTQLAYKLFRIKDGKLYPLFVHANEEMPIGVWLKAKSGEKTEKGKVRSQLGPLAYRPGFHAGDYPVATHIGRKASRFDSAPSYRPKSQVWALVEYPDDVDWQEVANSRATRSKAGEVIASTAQITDQIPFDGFYRYKTNPNMTGTWMISGNMRILRVLSDQEVEEVNSKAGLKDLPREDALDKEVLFQEELYRGAEYFPFQEDEIFNAKLDAFAAGTLKDGEVLKVGEPRGPLKAFVPKLPLYIRQSVLKKITERHGVSLESIRDLPTKMSLPVFIFSSKNANARLAIIDAVNQEGENILTAVRFYRSIHEGRSVIEVNDIASMYGKSAETILYWIGEDDLLLWADKKKGLDWIERLSGSHSRGVLDNQGLEDNRERAAEQTGSHSRRQRGIDPDLLKKVYTQIEEKSNIPEGDFGELLFQTEEELMTEARNYASAEEFEEYMEFLEQIDMGEDDSPVPDLPPAEKKEWYREFWERARTEEDPAERAGSLNARFVRELRARGGEGLRDFLSGIYETIVGRRQNWQPASPEEAAEMEEAMQKAAQVERAVHPLVQASAISVGRHGRQLNPKTAKALLTIMKNAAPEYRGIYAEVMEKPEFAEAAGAMAGSPVRLKESQIADWETYSITERMRIAREIQDLELRKKIESGEVADLEVKGYIERIEEENKTLESEIRAKEREIADDTRRMSYAEKTFISLRDQLQEKEKEIEREKKLSGRLTQRGQAVGDALLSARREASMLARDIKRTQRELRRNERVRAVEEKKTALRELKEKLRMREAEKRAAQKIRDLKLKIARKIMKPVSPEAVEFFTAEKIRQLQSFLDPHFLIEEK